MKLAIVTPPSMLECSGSINMVLAQVYDENFAYAEHYLLSRRRGTFTILDNGAAEAGRSISPQRLFEIALELGPHVVVAPDVIYNAQETTELTLYFLNDYSKYLLYRGISVMAVPQGKDLTEWLECFKFFYHLLPVSWIGVSKFYEPKVIGGRYTLLLWIKYLGLTQKPVHLLGCWDDPYCFRYERKFDFVKSADTSKPVSLGLQGLKLFQWRESKGVTGFFCAKPMNRDIIAWNVKRLISIVERGV